MYKSIKKIHKYISSSSSSPEKVLTVDTVKFLVRFCLQVR